MALIWLFFTILVVMAIVLMTMNTKFSRFAGWISLIALLISSIYFLGQIKYISIGHTVSFFKELIPIIEFILDLRLDALSLIFSLLISLSCAGVCRYAIY